MADYTGTNSEANRQSLLEKQREQMLQQFALQRSQIEKEHQVQMGSDKFVQELETMENNLKRSTVGLVKLEEFQRIRSELEEKQSAAAAVAAAASSRMTELMMVAKRNTAKSNSITKKKKRNATKLTFQASSSSSSSSSSSEETNQPEYKRKKLGKDPTVDTSFLPDRDREAKERRMREQLRLEWLEKQEIIKRELIKVTYSYWDGSGHRREVTCKKGDSIATFLELCRLQFPELRSLGVDNLMYIKEDLIIPHHYTFYDFIINKARGKSGPLFNFEVRDDVRLVMDATIEKEESHAGKVVERSWYERNKHIFPASRWELYDPSRDYGAYTIKDSSGGRGLNKN